MALWYHTFDDAFWLAVIPMILGLVAVALKSKCSKCSCWGIVVERDIAAEIQAEAAAAPIRQKSKNSLTPSSPLGLGNIQLDTL